MFKVRITNGPAEGWEYVTAVTPDRRIYVAPNPRPESHIRFMRVLAEPAWPEQQAYDLFTEAEEPDEDGDIVLEYLLVTDQKGAD